MFSEAKRKFLFRCQKCDMIISVDFETQDDFDKIQANELELECPCGSHCMILRD